MKKKKTVSIIAIVLAVLMLLSLLSAAIPLVAHAEEESAELTALRQKKAQLSAQVKQIKEQLDGLKEEQVTVLEVKAALEEQNTLAAEQIAIVEQEIAHYDELIRTKAAEVDAARGREQLQLERYRTRIRAMEENGGYNILALVFEAENFADLLTAFDDMGEIMQSDKQLQKQYEAARAETEEIKAQFEAEKAVYEADQAALEEEKADLESQIRESEERLEELSADIEKAIAAYEAAETAEADAAAAIANLIKQNQYMKAQERAAIQAEAKRQIEEMQAANAAAAANGEDAPYTEEQLRQTAEVAEIGYVSSASGFTWPLPCSTRVTSRYGTRSDPFTGSSATHNGLDIDGFGNDGSPVVAAAAGTVITASYDSAYGNYVVIDHGGTSTVYAHMSSLSVSAGQSVSQGQTIGAVGSTGRATGTHLHFEVYDGDERVDPSQYFSGISYYQC